MHDEVMKNNEKNNNRKRGGNCTHTHWLLITNNWLLIRERESILTSSERSVYLRHLVEIYCH